MFGSKPFTFKRPTTKRRLIEGALSAPAIEPVAAFLRACCFFLSALLALFLYSFVMIKEAGYVLCGARGEYE